MTPDPIYINTGMQVKDWINLTIGSGGLVGISILLFRMGRMVERLEQVYSNHLPHIYELIKEIQIDLKSHDKWERSKSGEGTE